MDLVGTVYFLSDDGKWCKVKGKQLINIKLDEYEE